MSWTHCSNGPARWANPHQVFGMSLSPPLQMSHVLLKLVLVQIILHSFHLPFKIYCYQWQCVNMGASFKVWILGSKQQVLRVGTLSHSFYQCKIKSHWFGAGITVAHTEWKFVISFPLLVQVALGKVLIGRDVIWFTTVPTPRIVTFVILVTPEDCICLEHQQREGRIEGEEEEQAC